MELNASKHRKITAGSDCNSAVGFSLCKTYIPFEVLLMLDGAVGGFRVGGWTGGAGGVSTHPALIESSKCQIKTGPFASFFI